MVIRSGSRGKFIACSGYPRCRNTEPIDKLEELRAAAAEAPAPAASDAEGDRATKKSKKKPKGGATQPPADDGVISYTRNGNPVVERLEGTVACPACGKELTLKRGRFGAFLSCSGFPNCRQTVRLKGKAREEAEKQLGPAPKRPKPEPTDIDCDQCGAKMVIRTGRSGRFLGCSKYPKCRHTKPLPAELERAGTS
jgi:DNA topoisomerase-1